MHNKKKNRNPFSLCSTQTHQNKLGGNFYSTWRDLQESCSQFRQIKNATCCTALLYFGLVIAPQGLYPCHQILDTISSQIQIAHVHETDHKIQMVYEDVKHVNRSLTKMKMPIKQAHSVQSKPENKPNLSTGNCLECPAERCPATSCILAQVTVNDSDSSHWNKCDNWTSGPVQFGFVTFPF